MSSRLISDIENIINDYSDDEAQILWKLKEVILKTEGLRDEENLPESISDLAAQRISAIANGYQDPDIFKTGIRDFDFGYKGFLPGEVIVIGGRPGMGKTQMTVNIACNISQQHPVLFFTFDLSVGLITGRAIAHFTRIPPHRQQKKLLTAAQQNRILKASESLAKCRLFIKEGFSRSIFDLIAYCRNQIEKNAIRVIIFDFFQLMKAGGRHESRSMELDVIVRELKLLAKEREVCIIITSQVDRKTDEHWGDKNPKIANLTDSEGLEQNADKILFIYRPEYYGYYQDEAGNSLKGYAELEIAKNRNGPTGKVYLSIDPGFTAFQDYDQNPNNIQLPPDLLGGEN